jgi:short-subunit dehydrogenase
MADRNFALVTGASSGIGESFARALAARNENLVLVARSEERLQKLSHELAQNHGIETLPCAADLSVPGAPGQLAQWLKGRQIHVHLLVNNAGFGVHGEFLKLPLERQMQMLRLNVEAVLELSWLLIPPMLEHRQGGVINVSSALGFQPAPFVTAYAATKAFVTSFSMGLAAELDGSGVRVVTLCPGTTRTSFFDAGGFSRGGFRRVMQEPSEVVAKALKALDRGGGLVLPRKVDHVLIFVERLLPRSWVVAGAAQLFRKKD